MNPKTTKQKLSEIKNSLRNSKFHFVRKHQDQQDAMFRVPLKLAQVEELITLIDDHDYMFQSLKSLAKQIENIYPELDTLTRIGKSVYNMSDTFGAAADGKAILDAVQQIEDIIGKRNDIETDEDMDEGATL